MGLVTTSITAIDDQTTDDRSRRALGVAAATIGGAASVVWIGWRVWTLDPGLITLVALALEVLTFAASGLISITLARADRPRSVFDAEHGAMDRFPYAIADLVGRTRAGDVRRDLRQSISSITGSDRVRLPDVAMTTVLLDGPRRLAGVVLVATALLFGVAPMPTPPNVVIGAGVSAVIAFAVSHVALGRGRVRAGDRLRWTYAAVGEVLLADDVDGVAPRTWVGTAATVVTVNLAIALRGISDRWTHGLAPMPDDERAVTMVLAAALVAGALYTLRVSTTPSLENAGVVSRRTEERTARRSVLGGAVCVGAIGLFAGILPGDVEAADDDPLGVEVVTEFETVAVSGGSGDG